ncbi:hypothetical protein JX266_012087 [Neoarthrinium moseri]|nr:hypothetical protein JX266_012087 [Neoarthrinium moseri]
MSDIWLLTVPKSRLDKCRPDLDQAEDLDHAQIYVYTLLPSDEHWEVVTFKVSQGSLLGKTVTICETSSFPCCAHTPESDISKGPGSKFFKNFDSGTWFNAGHTRHPPESVQSTSCKEREKDAVQSLKARLKAILPAAQEKHQLVASSPATSAIHTLEAGFGLLKIHSDPVHYDIKQTLTSIQAKYASTSDLKALANGFAGIAKACRISAQESRWRMKHLEKCTLILDDQRGTNSTYISSGYDRTASRIGGAGLLVMAAAAVKGFSFGELRDVNCSQLADEVYRGILCEDVQVARDIRLFNPALFLSKFLQEKYETICLALGLGNLSDLPQDGSGIFCDMTLKDVMKAKPNGYVEEPSITKPYWTIKGTGNRGLSDKQPARSMKKRKQPMEETMQHFKRARQSQSVEDKQCWPGVTQQDKQVTSQMEQGSTAFEYSQTLDELLNSIDIASPRGMMNMFGFDDVMFGLPPFRETGGLG